jgi:hypothetical protein
MAAPVVPAGMGWRMRRIATAAILTTATVFGALTPALGQITTAPPPPIIQNARPALTPLGFYAVGSFACVVVSPMIGTVMLGRELTPNEFYHTSLGCMLGPPSWLIADHFFPLTAVVAPGQPGSSKKPPGRSARGRHISIPPSGAISHVPDEVLTLIDPSVSQPTLDRIAGLLQITPVEAQRFTLMDRTVQRWRITGNRSVRATLRLMLNYPGITAQPNYLYRLQQSPAGAATNAAAAQYVVS